MKPELVIFDCDGVLVDTETVGNRVLSDFFSRHGLAISPEECFHLFAGGSMEETGKQAIKHGAKLPENWVEQIYVELFDALAQSVEPAPYIHPLLNALEENEIATAIASNGPLEKMSITLAPSGLLKRFEGNIYSAHTHGPAKPEPALLLKACQDAEVAPKQAIMVDDSPTGLRAATAAGATPVGYMGFGNTHDLSPYCTQCVSGMDDLVTLLKL